MELPFSLLKCVGKAVLNYASGGSLGDAILNVLPDIAGAAWKEWCPAEIGDAQRNELAALARAPFSQVLAMVQAVVGEIAPDHPEPVRQNVASYLAQVPAAIRQSLRRPTDPTGTMIPAGLVLRRCEDLLPLLPARLPRFRPGDRPLPGVDLELVELLGVGGFGEVWKARNPHLPGARPVALKFCRDAAAAQVLRHEAAVLNQVMSQGWQDGVVQLQATYLSANPPCLQYECVEGGDLAGLIQEAGRTQGGLPALSALQIMHRLASVLAQGHRLSPAVVHRDLKPANILVEKVGGAYRFKVADFGIGGLAARRALEQTRRGISSAQRLTTVLRGTFTPLYASPEQYAGNAPDPRDDVFALGVIWYQLMTGDLTSGVPSGSRWKDYLRQRGMTGAEVELLCACVEGRAADRPADAAVLAQKLAELLLARSARQTPPPPPAPRRDAGKDAPMPVIVMDPKRQPAAPPVQPRGYAATFGVLLAATAPSFATLFGAVTSPWLRGAAPLAAVAAGLFVGVVFGLVMAIFLKGDVFRHTFGDARAFVASLTQLLARMGYALEKGEAGRLSFKPTFKAGLLSGKITVQMEGNQATVVGPSVYLNNLRRGLRALPVVLFPVSGNG
jgi:serine/threonine protein kinase